MAESLRQLLNRLRWNPGEEPEGVVITFRTREQGEEQVEELPFAAVCEILPAGVTMARERFIPYHRVIELRRGGRRIWSASHAKGGSDEG